MTLTTTAVPSSPHETVSPDAQTSAWRMYWGLLSTAITVLVVVIASVAVVIAVATHFATDGEYTVFGHPVMTVLSGSMTPAIKTGDLIVDNRVGAKQATHLKVGQIASFYDSTTSKTVITHRVVGLTIVNGEVAYTTKGDANQSADLVPRPASDVIGTFDYAIPRGGYVLTALHRPLVLGLLLASPVLWFIAGPLYAYARRLDQAGPVGQEPATTSAGEAEADAP